LSVESRFSKKKLGELVSRAKVRSQGMDVPEKVISEYHNNVFMMEVVLFLFFMKKNLTYK